MSRLVRLSVLDTYGVRWPALTLARDLLQNFYDASPDFLGVELDLDREARRIEIRGPSSFDADLLAFIGATTKRDGSTVGGFGEGFKICALVATRDFGVSMHAGTGTAELEVVYQPTSLGRELCYRVEDQDPRVKGSFVHLDGCPDALFEAFEEARNDFIHPDNPRLGEVLAGDLAQGCAVIRSRLEDVGELYYRRQKRGRLRWYSMYGEPLTFVLHEAVPALDGDRDRRDVPAQALATEVGLRLSPEELWKALLAMVKCWEYGHELLHGLIAAATKRALKFTFPPGWISRAEIKPYQRGLARHRGINLGLASFAVLGMPTAAEFFPATHPTREPTDLERAQVQVVADLHRELTGFTPAMKELEVFDGRIAITGMHQGGTVTMSADELAQGFDVAAGTLLHEFSHDAGDETSDGFLDRLTAVLDGLARKPEAVRQARERYRLVTEDDAPPPPPFPDPQDYSLRWGTSVDVYGLRGHPPTEALLRAVVAAVKKLDVQIRLDVVEVDDPSRGVVGLKAVPELVFARHDFDPMPDEAPLGVHPRLFGGKAAPAEEEIVAFIESLREGDGWKAPPPRPEADDEEEADANEETDEDEQEEGAEPKAEAAPARPKTKTAEELDDERCFWIRHYASYRIWHERDTLKRLWYWAQAVAIWRLALERRAEPLEPKALVDAVASEIQALLHVAWNLRGADREFDAGDSFEEGAMCFAQGWAVAMAAMHPVAAERPQVAEDAYRKVRRATSQLFALYVPNQVRRAILEATADAMCGSTGDIQEDAIRPPAAFDPTFEEMVAFGLKAFAQDPNAGRRVRADDVLSQRPKSPEQLEQERTAYAAVLVRAARARRRRRAYDETLARTGDLLAASRASLEAVAPLASEEAA